jgi:deoxyribodipyrimidine photolyase-related protein
MYYRLRLILGDQLNESHSWFDSPSDEVLYVMMELRQETDYAPHHIQKVCAFFLAMRAFAEQMQERGHHFLYLTLDNPRNTQSLTANLDGLLSEHPFREVAYQLPDEYRLDQQLAAWASAQRIPVQAVDSEHFLTRREELAECFRGKKTYLMETFYRQLRKRYGFLMEPGGDPLTGRWNYDSENRKAYDGKQPVPSPIDFAHPAGEIRALLARAGVETIGELPQDLLSWPITRQEALQALEYFLAEGLPHFGTYQDAMSQAHWALFHARISFPLNVKLISPLEVIERSLAAWEARQQEISIAQVEGFIRQIAGWREYMRGVYWAQMPSYAKKNYFQHQRSLPSWFWTGNTRMNCLRHAIGQSLSHAYAHHIQRLMLTGNFALLAGIAPDEVDRWYLGIYIDAIEWVEITNTRGMSQYADGGLVGTKPYVSSANYIHSMSDYCGSCAYDRSKRHGPMACPFNSLYWDFYHRHGDLLGRNPRIGFAYKTLAKMDPEEKTRTLSQAAHYLEHLEDL